MIYFPRNVSDQAVDPKTVELDDEDFVCKIVEFGLSRELKS